MRDNIKHIFFDLDHTLWDFDKNSKLALAALFSQYGISLELSKFLKVYEPVNYAYWARFRIEQVTKTELRRGRLRDSFAPFGLTFTDGELDAMSETYIDELPKNNHLFDGVIETLEELHARYSLHIITNGFHQVQHDKLCKSGLKDYFESVTTSEEVGVKKPNPIIFRKALEKARAQPQTSVMVGDTFEADILGAEAVGMDTLFFNYWSVETPPNYAIIDNIQQIKLYL